jgi:uncharacterized linocin/CFP29 family protein
MNSLYRELAPVPDAAWEQIETEASQALKRTLAARQLVDFEGPLGWRVSSVDPGRTQVLENAPHPGVETRMRKVQPLIELRIPFELARSEIDAIDRGAADADLQPVIDAARTAALAEDSAIFYGCREGGITGICEAATARSLLLTDDYSRYPDVVAEALNQLRTASVDGPYAIALGPRCYTGLTQTRDAGYPVIEHVRRLLDGPIIWAPAADGALILSLRGGDFQLSVGQDFSIGYLEHTAASVRLYLQESFTFRVNAPEAAIPLRYEEAASL